MRKGQQSGVIGEARAAEYLRKNGYSILAKNWRTRYCEIDIIVQKSNTIYFVEVKYRHTDRFGRAIDYITPGKQRRMRYAAESWLAQNDSIGLYTVLSVIAIDGDALEFISDVE